MHTEKLIRSSDIHRNEYNVPIDQLQWRPAAYGIIIQDDHILLTKQHGQLHLPGGGVELGEMPEAGVLREIHEETGLIAADPCLIDMISGFFTHTSDEAETHYHSILLYFTCRIIGGELSIDEMEEGEKLIGEMPVWVPIDELDMIEAGSTIDWRSVVKRYVAVRPVNFAT